ncbi:hypothetical protein ACN082_06215 [Rothia sp. CCM 9417]|uniref:hypothetical protein n=1 Tax=Rothia sp. CCM 9417 TaxID=3402657 RepID=UPI003ADBF19D
MRQRQLIRAWFVACAATGFGASSHLLAGGHLPNPLILALATSLAALLTLGATRVKLSQFSLATGVLAGQGLLHGLYSHSQSATLTAGSQVHTSHTHGAQLQVSALHAEPQSLAMWLGHLCAALATYAVLAYGEQMYSLLRALLKAAQRFFTPFHLRGFLPAKHHIPGFQRPGSIRGATLGTCRLTRGPPALAMHP